MATRDVIYGFLEARSRPARLPAPWSMLKCHPGWLSLDCEKLLPDLLNEFDIGELDAAGVTSRNGDEIVLDARLSSHSDLIFAMRTENTLPPYALLPGGCSLSMTPAFCLFLGDYRALPLIDDRQPLLLVNDPLDMAILSSCGCLVAPAPAVAQMNAMFLKSISYALSPTSHVNSDYIPRVHLLGWRVAALANNRPAGHDERLAQLQKLEYYFEPELHLDTWPTDDDSLDELRFKLSFATAKEVGKCLQEKAHFGTSPLEEYKSAGKTRPPVDHVGAYLQACLKRAPPRDIQRLREEYVQALRDQVVRPLTPADATLEGAGRIKQQLIAEAAYASIVDVIEAVAEMFVPPNAGSRDKPSRRVTSATSGLNRVIDLLGGQDKQSRKNPFSLRCVG
jgi:hypothetical protein